MQYGQTTFLKNDCSKDTSSKLDSFDFSAVYTLKSQEFSEFRTQLTSFIFHSLLAEERLGKYIYIYIPVLGQIYIYIFQFLQPILSGTGQLLSYYPILILQNRNKIANVKSDCDSKILLDSRMWKRLAQPKNAPYQQKAVVFRKKKKVIPSLQT